MVGCLKIPLKSGGGGGGGGGWGWEVGRLDDKGQAAKGNILFR